MTGPGIWEGEFLFFLGDTIDNETIIDGEIAKSCLTTPLDLTATPAFYCQSPSSTSSYSGNNDGCYCLSSSSPSDNNHHEKPSFLSSLLSASSSSATTLPPPWQFDINYFEQQQETSFNNQIIVPEIFALSPEPSPPSSTASSWTSDGNNILFADDADRLLRQKTFPTFVCDGCSGDFSSERSLHNHLAKSKSCPLAIRHQQKPSSDNIISSGGGGGGGGGHHHHQRQDEALVPEQFSCKFCSSTFYVRGNLRRHERLFHRQQSSSSPPSVVEASTNDDFSQKFCCNICPRSYASLAYLRQHKRKLHGDILNQHGDCRNSLRFVCNRSGCHQRFHNETALAAHLRWCKIEIDK